MARWFGPQIGNCSCCECGWITWDYTLHQLGDQGDPAGHPELELIGSASYAETPAGQGHILFPGAGAGIRTITENPFITSAVLNCSVVFKIDAQGSLPEDPTVPVGTRYRLFFESDQASSSYVYCDLTYKSYQIDSYSDYKYWIAELGVRANGSDTLLHSWFSPTQQNVQNQVVPYPSFTDGYLQNYEAWAFQLERFPQGYAGDCQRMFTGTVSNSYSLDGAGASIVMPLPEPAGRYCGLIRMDSTAGGVTPRALTFRAGRAGLATESLPSGTMWPNNTWACIAASDGVHNQCRLAEPAILRAEIPSQSYNEFIVVLPYAIRGGSNLGGNDIRDLTNVDELEDERANDGPFSAGDVTNEGFRVSVAGLWPHNRGIEDPTLLLEVELLHLKRYETNDPFLPEISGWRFFWAVNLPIVGRDIDCPNFELTLDPADANISAMTSGFGFSFAPLSSLPAPTWPAITDALIISMEAP